MRILCLCSLLFVSGCWKLLPSPPKVSNSSPTPAKEGATWTPSELVEYLNKKGLNVTATQPSESPFTGDIHFYIRFADDQCMSVEVKCYKTMERAKSLAPIGPQDDSFTFGRFVIETHYPCGKWREPKSQKSQDPFGQIKKTLGL